MASDPCTKRRTRRCRRRGHVGFPGSELNVTLVALKELGFHDVHDILSRAVSVFPGSQVPKDWKRRNDLVEGFSTDERLANYSDQSTVKITARPAPAAFL